MEASTEYVVKGFRKRIDTPGADYTEAKESIGPIDIQTVPPDTKFTLAEELIVQQKTMTKAEAKKAILDLFRQKGELDYGDIIEELGLDLEVVVEMCRELEEEGRIEAMDR